MGTRKLPFTLDGEYVEGLDECFPTRRHLTQSAGVTCPWAQSRRSVIIPSSQLNLHRRELAIALSAALVPEGRTQLLHDLPIWFHAQTSGPLVQFLWLDQLL